MGSVAGGGWGTGRAAAGRRQNAIPGGGRDGSAAGGRGLRPWGVGVSDDAAPDDLAKELVDKYHRRGKVRVALSLTPRLVVKVFSRAASGASGDAFLGECELSVAGALNKVGQWISEWPGLRKAAGPDSGRDGTNGGVSVAVKVGVCACARVCGASGRVRCPQQLLLSRSVCAGSSDAPVRSKTSGGRGPPPGNVGGSPGRPRWPRGRTAAPCFQMARPPMHRPRMAAQERAAGSGWVSGRGGPGAPTKTGTALARRPKRPPVPSRRRQGVGRGPLMGRRSLWCDLYPPPLLPTSLP